MTCSHSLVLGRDSIGLFVLTYLSLFIISTCETVWESFCITQ